MIDFRTEAAILFQFFIKNICWNKKRENNLKNIYKKDSVLLTKKSK